MNDKITVTGHYLFEGFDKKGNKVFEKEISNIITNGFYEAVINFLEFSTNPPASALNVTHIALGTGTTTASRGDIRLVNERFRKQITTKSKTVNQFVYKLSLAGEEANFVIREVGTFTNANNTANNGLLISRANVNIEKNSSIQYLITFTITMQ